MAKLRELIEYMERKKLIGGSNHSFFSAFELLTIVPSADFVPHNNAGGYLIEGIPHKRTVLLEYTHSNLQFFKLFNYMVNSTITYKIFSVFKLIFYNEFKSKSFKKISDIRKIFEEALDFYYIINVCRFIWKNSLIIYLTLQNITLKLFHNEAENHTFQYREDIFYRLKSIVFVALSNFSQSFSRLIFQKGGIGMSNDEMLTREDLREELKTLKKELLDEIGDRLDEIEEKLRKQERKISKLDYELTRTIIQPKATRRNFAISPRGALHDEEELIASWKI